MKADQLYTAIDSSTEGILRRGSIENGPPRPQLNMSPPQGSRMWRDIRMCYRQTAPSGLDILAICT